MNDQFPAVVPDSVEVELARPLVPRRFSDSARAIGAAQLAVDRLNADDDGEDQDSDGELVLLPGHLAVGSTPGAALRRAADFCDAAPELDVDSISLARMPGHVEDAWEWHVTLVFSSADPATGESAGSLHHGYRRAGRSGRG
jgi:hypothetical protein